MDRHVVPFDGLLCPDDPWIDPRLAAELSDGERVIWAGRPVPSLLALQALPITLFAIPWTAFAVFWTIMASGATLEIGGDSSDPTPEWVAMLFPLFGLPFVVIGMWMLGIPLRVRRAAQRGLFALTDQRCITWQQVSGKKVEVRSYPLAEGLSYKREQRTDGRGSLLFLTDEPETRTNPRTRSVQDLAGHAAGFVCIEDVAGVEKQLRDALNAAAPR